MSDPTKPVLGLGLPYDLADAFEQLPVGAAIFDTSHAFCCLRHNRRFLEAIGRSGDEHTCLVGAGLHELLAAESYGPTRAIFERVLAEGAPFASDDYAARMEWEREPRSFQWSLTPLRGPDGAISALFAAGIDITRRKAFEAEARAAARRANEERALLDTLINTAPIGIAFFDRELRLVRINERLAQLSGLPVAAHLGRRLSEILPPVAAAIEPVMQQVLATGCPVMNVESTLPPELNGGVWMKSFYPIHDLSGEILGVGALVTDVSDERRMQAELRAITIRERERAADLEALLYAVPAVVWIAHDSECRVITGSRAASQLLRMAPQSNQSKSAPEPEATTHFRVLHKGVELAPEELPVQQAACGREIHDFEEDVVFDDGTVHALLGNATPLRDEHGRSRGAVAAFLDITERKQAEQERDRLLAAEQAARAEAEAALKIRDTFFSMAAHELKTPLTALLGHVQLFERRTAQSGTLSARDQRVVQAIVSQAARMNKLIDAMLDLTRIERGYLTLERAPLDIAAVAQRVLNELKPAHARHRFIWRGPDTPVMIVGDPLRLEQVLYNLVENAVKYSPNGGEVVVSAERAAAQARISVRDQGVGIPQTDIPHLFERFFRASNVGPRHIAGMGIGLYVVREIVSLHGGEIHVESVEGEGSHFLVSLPLLAAEEQAPWPI